MKNLKSTFVLTFILSMFLLVSCDKDDNPAQNSTGDYWPTAINNQWVLNQDGIESTIKIISTDNFDGATYYKFNQMLGVGESMGGEASVWLKKNKGDYYIKMGDININVLGITASITGYEFIFFKDYLDVNQTWTGTYSHTTTYNYGGVPPIKTTVNYKGTILEKGTSLKVNGINYTDVIKFRIRQEGSYMGQSSVVDADYWVSKNIGVIKMTSGGSVSELVSYVVK